jgi:hypothetical protein
MKCHNTFIYGSKMGNEKDVVPLEIESVIFIMKSKLIMKCVTIRLSCLIGYIVDYLYLLK